jgi:ATP-dependent RNA helicase DHX29
MERVEESIINFDLIEDILQLLMIKKDYSVLCPPDISDISKGAFLIFLPGIGEIRELCDRLTNSRTLQSEGVVIVPLHSMLSSDEQRQAFAPCRPGCRKIIVSTNIAETSVTIPDVVCGK